MQTVLGKLLIANRGEIVSRIIKACRELNIKAVAVYSSADQNAPYLKEADETYYLGPANPLESYLNIGKLIEIMKISKADAVHPGYGFLAENYTFAQAVVSNGAIWVGPQPEVLKAVESKCYCRKVASSVGVPVLPGSNEPLRDASEIKQWADKLGYPLLLKLDKGGGGKGITSISKRTNVQDEFEKLSRIGNLAFGSGDCFVEKQVDEPRHIEVQFIVDHFGNCVCLGERECSIQRRYQKIIEESPSPVISEVDREVLYDYTVKLAKAMGYVNAGTIEYLRSQDGKFYFMEVNARLQVEHPVTEMVTGIDIVKNQLKIAAGEKITLTQDDIKLNGHAIEARIYAEDPFTFVPSPGKIEKINFPLINNSFIRIDHAIEEGVKVPPYYDPMLAKVIAWGMTRKEAILRLKETLINFCIEGVKTITPLILNILNDDDFINGKYDTGFVNKLLVKKFSV
ncbi:MAG: biotin carboxylase N-terminal domain-containing protein [Conexivisphaerales archaeon]